MTWKNNNVSRAYIYVLRTSINYSNAVMYVFLISEAPTFNGVICNNYLSYPPIFFLPPRSCCQSSILWIPYIYLFLLNFCRVHVVWLLKFFSWSKLVINSLIGFQIRRMSWSRFHMSHFLNSSDIVLSFTSATPLMWVMSSDYRHSSLDYHDDNEQVSLFFPGVGKMSSRFF